MQLFVVFHKFIFDECYLNIPKEILDKYFLDSDKTKKWWQFWK